MLATSAVIELLTLERFMNKEDMTRIVGVLSREERFFNIAKEINYLLAYIWKKQIDVLFFHDGRCEQFTEAQRATLFIVTRRPPTLNNFAMLKRNVIRLSLQHPIREQMRTILDMLTPLVSVIQDMHPTKAYINASVRTYQ
jgi:hypothetical protein